MCCSTSFGGPQRAAVAESEEGTRRHEQTAQADQSICSESSANSVSCTHHAAALTPPCALKLAPRRDREAPRARRRAQPGPRRSQRAASRATRRRSHVDHAALSLTPLTLHPRGTAARARRRRRSAVIAALGGRRRCARSRRCPTRRRRRRRCCTRRRRSRASRRRRRWRWRSTCRRSTRRCTARTGARHCFNQKMMFGAGATRQYVNYVECAPDGYKSERALCLVKDVGVPELGDQRQVLRRRAVARRPRRPQRMPPGPDRPKPIPVAEQKAGAAPRAGRDSPSADHHQKTNPPTTTTAAHPPRAAVVAGASGACPHQPRDECRRAASRRLHLTRCARCTTASSATCARKRGSHASRIAPRRRRQAAAAPPERPHRRGGRRRRRQRTPPRAPLPGSLAAGGTGGAGGGGGGGRRTAVRWKSVDLNGPMEGADSAGKSAKLALLDRRATRVAMGGSL